MDRRLACLMDSLALPAGLTAAALLTATAAPSAPRAVAGPSCASAPGDTPADVATVTQDLDLKLVDGRVIRLAGIDPPRPTAANPDFPAEGRRGLEGWLAEQAPQGGASPRAVVIRWLAAVPDRWNRIPALAFVPRRRDPAAAVGTSAVSAEAGSTVAPSPAASNRSDPPSAAEALLAQGLARARPDPLVHDCFQHFLEAEDAARTHHLGLWADPHEAVLGADDTDGLARQAGGMVVVQGVLRVHESRGTQYLTLGRNRWGFTAVLSRRNAERFAKAGLDLADYAGTPVRLRGDYDTRFGPRIDLTDPDQVESLEPGTETVHPAAAISDRTPGHDVRTGERAGSRWKR